MTGSIYSFGLCALGLCLLLGQLADAGASRGCGRPLNPRLKKGGTGQSNKINFTTSKGVKRTFLLHFPSNYDEDRPHGLIFSFHGRTHDGAQQESLSKMSESAKNPHMLVVYPDGIDNQWQGDPAATTDDVGFTLDMINALEAQYCIDPDQIFAAGQSNGGGFSANILACDSVASRRIAAFAGVSGAYYQGTSDANCDANTVPIKCNPGRKNVPVLEFHGKADETIPYDGGKRRNRCLPYIPYFMTAWAQRNGLSARPTNTSLHSGHVQKMEWGNGSTRGINTHYAIDNMPHTWPGDSKYYVNATPLIMDFFERWTLATTPGARTTSYSSSLNTPAPICPYKNGQPYWSSGKNFRISCSADTPNTPAYTGATTPGSFAACIAECAAEAQCGHAVYYYDRCWKKKGRPSYVARAGDFARVAVKN